ncbi:MAG TPA: type III-B CRISPR module-associated protein Cmr5 [Firmicutes bacterium]|nr:type III-B CRISPR module-associated protein Cmr5 [Bacillota bacterium]
MRTLEQERAEFAWQKVQRQSDEYRNLVKSLPAMIMTNGLMQTLAFLQGKGKDHHRDLVNHIVEWLSKREMVEKGSDFKRVMEKLYGSSFQEYQRATEEVLAILRWLRQLVDATIGKS